MKITVGSTSTVKLAAMLDACSRLGIAVSIGLLKTYSGQNEQPLNFSETYRGALARAEQAQESNPDSLAIGIENGIFNLAPEVFLDIAVIVAITPDGRQIVASSEGIRFPTIDVKAAAEKGFSVTTVGQTITQRLGGDPADPHSTLTNGKRGRKDILTDAMVSVLKQVKTKE